MQHHVANGEARVAAFDHLPDRAARHWRVELERRVDELAKTNRELEQKSAENESFVYSVSHDLRSPLVNIQGFSQELGLGIQSLQQLLSRSDVPADVRERCHELIAVELTESIDYIHNAVRHLGTIIDGLLRLSRIGRIEYESKDVDMNALAEALRRAPTRALSSALAEVVDRVTRPRVFVALGLWPGLDGGDAWVGVPRWPTG